MLKAFIKSIRHQIMIVALFLLLFLMIFFLICLSMPSRYGNYSFHNDYFWLIQLSGFQEAVSLKEEVADLEDELQRVK